jgi:hypothetical protein
MALEYDQELESSQLAISIESYLQFDLSRDQENQPRPASSAGAAPACSHGDTRLQPCREGCATSAYSPDPRYIGDRGDPRGGVRWIIPENTGLHEA